MPIVTWTPEYSVSVGEMDTQHQRLFDLINKLHDAMSSSTTDQAIPGIIDELANYTQTHFSAEEQLMQANNYPGYLEQKSQHDQFIGKVNEIKANFSSGSAGVATTAFEITDFLKSWLINHIQQQDKQYGPFLNQAGIN